jgi:hypothetical protein
VENGTLLFVLIYFVIGYVVYRIFVKFDIFYPDFSILFLCLSFWPAMVILTVVWIIDAFSEWISKTKLGKSILGIKEEKK